STAAEEQALIDQYLTPTQPNAAGAQVTDITRGSGRIEGALAMERALGFQSAGIRALGAEERNTRLTALDLAETAMSREDSARGVVASQGGPVESMIREDNVPL